MLPLLLACTAADPDPRPDVVLIIIDTLRADRLGAYGAERDTSPAIDALAASGVRFDDAYSAASWTIPSVTSILTGRYPSQHGVTTAKKKLSASLETLPEVLQARGYQTGAVFSHTLIGASRGFDAGYDRFVEELGEGDTVNGRISSQAVTDAALDLLSDFSRSEPYFLLVHYFDPHYDYNDHEAWVFAAPSAGRLDGDEGIWTLREMAPPLSAAEVGFLRDRYDEEIRFTDHHIGRLLAALDPDRTVVALTADHGEEFMERGWLGHTRTLHEELVSVPLIVRAPDSVAGRAVEGPVSLTALAPTLLALAGHPDGMPQAAEPSLDAVIRDPSPPPVPGQAFFEVDVSPLKKNAQMKRAHKKGMVIDHTKVIYDADARTWSAFDLSTDPGETTHRPDLLDALRPALLARMAALGATAAGLEEVLLDEAELERLRLLGYVEESADP